MCLQPDATVQQDGTCRSPILLCCTLLTVLDVMFVRHTFLACSRCGWDCEVDGYDDDSQPLPRFKAKFDAFVAILKAGRAPAWEKDK